MPEFRWWMGDIIVLNKLSLHRGSGLREAIEARGATLLHLPPYSPNLTRSKSLFPCSNACCAMRLGSGGDSADLASS
jgi:hypothetical protein